MQYRTMFSSLAFLWSSAEDPYAITKVALSAGRVEHWRGSP
jgi:hypothetical protein